MFCKNCGEQMDDLALACAKCGTPVAVQPQPQTQPPQYQPPTYQQTTPPQYQQPFYQQPFVPQSQHDDEHVSMGGWIGIFCLGLIPFVGWLVYIIMLFVWAFGDTKKKTLKNFSKAILLFYAIILGLTFVGVIIAAIAGVSLADYFNVHHYYNTLIISAGF